MMKKLLCLLLATVTVLCLVTACANNSPNTEETTPEESSTSNDSDSEESSSEEVSESEEEFSSEEETTPEGESSTTTEEESSSEEDPPEETPSAYFPLVIQGTSVVTIVYPVNYEDYEWKAAEALADFIENESGVRPSLKTDDLAIDAGTVEILIGDTARTQESLLRAALTDGMYAIQMIDDRLVINGTLEGALTYAVDAIQEGVLKHGISSGGKNLLVPDTVLNIDYAYPLREEMFQFGKANLELFETCGRDYYMLYFTDATPSEFSAYYNKLLQCGMEAFEAPRMMLGTLNNYYASCIDGDAVVTMIGTADGLVRVFVERKSDNAYFSYENDNREENCEPLFFQIGTGTASGMSYVFRFANGEFFVVDGGHDDSLSDNAEYQNGERIVQILKEYAPDPNNICIVGWLITHPHTDHIGALQYFCKNYADDSSIRIENLLWNNYSERILLEDEEQNLIPKLAGYQKEIDKIVATGTKLHRTHVGQMFQFGDATLEIVYTHELRMGYNKLTSGNGLSIVSRFMVEGQTFLLTGDTTTKANKMMESVYGTALQVDFYQTPHHGHGGNTTTLAGLVNPKWVLWPTTNDSYETRKEKEHNAFFFGTEHRVEEHYIADNKTFVFHLPFDGTNVTVTENK